MADLSGSLALAAVTLGCLHTLAGPDHYLPFVAMSRVARWSLSRTLAITALCGLGHVLSSVALGTLGIACGFGLERLESIEATRGSWAAWLLIGFGLMYLVWGLRRAIRNRPHTHLHAHADGTVHRHAHIHEADHLHLHAPDPCLADHHHPAPAGRAPALTPWVLFILFLFGPCEVLIPMVMFPAARGSVWGVVWVTLLFGAATITTMLAIVATACLGINRLRCRALERYSHALAGFVVLACGVGIKFGL